MQPKPCKHCGGTGHTTFTCHRRPRTELSRKAFKRRLGPVGLKWAETRNDWMQKNPPKDGVWECYLKVSPYCQRYMSAGTLTLDHIKSRTRHPELRFVHSNLAPACAPCNEYKGSRDITELEV